MAEETKPCPDCAEQVLSAARVCRYCGYRFDRGARGRSSLAADVLSSLRKDTREASLDDILADWGVALATGEEAEFFRLVEIDGQPGFLLVTSARLVFFARSGRTRHSKLFEYPLAGVAHTYAGGALRGRRLQLRGSGWEHAVRTADRRYLERLAGCLNDAPSRPAKSGERAER
jgi:hypothetical protein